MGMAKNREYYFCSNFGSCTKLCSVMKHMAWLSNCEEVTTSYTQNQIPEGLSISIIRVIVGDDQCQGLLLLSCV